MQRLTPKAGVTATDAATTSRPRIASTPRQPRKSPITPETEAPSRLPVIEPASVRPIATWRFSGPTRSLVRLERDRKHAAGADAGKNAGREQQRKRLAIAPRMLANPSSTRHAIISRALPNRSAAAPTPAGSIAKVKANTEAKLAAVAMLTPNSSATCGSTGSSARADRLAAKVASAMMLIAGGMRSCGRVAVCGISASRSFRDPCYDFWQARRTPSASAAGLRTRAAAPCWDRRTAHGRDRDGFR